MIDKNENFVFLTHYEVISGFKNFDNSQKLIVIDFISYFN